MGKKTGNCQHIVKMATSCFTSLWLLQSCIKTSLSAHQIFCPLPDEQTTSPSVMTSSVSGWLSSAVDQDCDFWHLHLRLHLLMPPSPLITVSGLHKQTLNLQPAFKRFTLDTHWPPQFHTTSTSACWSPPGCKLYLQRPLVGVHEQSNFTVLLHTMFWHNHHLKECKFHKLNI